MKYRIRFYGTPLGLLPEQELPIRKTYCSRTVEADSVESARLDAKRTHANVTGTVLCDLKCATCEVMADPLECKACAGTGWISSARNVLEQATNATAIKQVISSGIDCDYHES